MPALLLLVVVVVVVAIRKGGRPPVVNRCRSPFLSLTSLLIFIPTYTHKRDTLLFNDAIYYNIAYGNLAASHEEVEAAAM